MPPPIGKRRTRAHILADLSANHVERQALLCGFSVERVAHDHGIDLLLTTYDLRGVVQNGYVAFQLKATDSPRRVANGSAVAYALDTRDLLHWLNEPTPVILVLYDGRADRAYWIYVQAYFSRAGAVRPGRGRRSVTVHLPIENVVDPTAMRQFARYRAAVQRQLRGAIRHDDEDAEDR
jgi:hypothetical protein